MPTSVDKQTSEEKRIRAQFRAEKARLLHLDGCCSLCSGLPQTIPDIVERLSEQWKRPYWEIERITKGHHIDTGENQ